MTTGVIAALTVAAILLLVGIYLWHERAEKRRQRLEMPPGTVDRIDSYKATRRIP